MKKVFSVFLVLGVLALQGCTSPTNEPIDFKAAKKGHFLIEIDETTYRAVIVRSGEIIKDALLRPIENYPIEKNSFGWVMDGWFVAKDDNECHELRLTGVNSSAPQYLIQPFLMSKKLVSPCNFGTADQWTQL